MTARLRIRRSRLARLSRWLGILAVPILVITGLAHRAGVMDPIAALMGIGVGSIFGFFAVLFAVTALGVIWYRGHLGTGDAFRGLIGGALALIPMGFVVWGILQFPQINDITTDIDNPPRFTGTVRSGWGVNGPAPPERDVRERQRAAYPDIVPRRFPLEPSQMFEAAKRAVAGLGWQMVSEMPPVEPFNEGHLQAIDRTLLFALPDDVAIRILPDDYGARLDVRSASRYGRHDIGTNARRIREFFAALDDAVLEVAAEAAGEEGEGDQPASE
ncbi:uncharacterized protein (DUF1499 family) [Rhodobium orientis]|nr:DUF1499 domain-containing protein [Rhodobium orientis]MBB4303882.1 uncharacterized protein (DUF1499 family) [Rhodobium orientis]